MYARCIHNSGSGATLEAHDVTALAEDGSVYSHGLHNTLGATADVSQSVLEGVPYSVYQNGNTVTVSNSRLAGGGVTGTVTCTLVTRGITVSVDGFTCP
jgi:hypothetical protein